MSRTAPLALAADYFDPPEEDGAASDRELALACSRDLRVFIREAWPLLEPARPFVGNWHIDVEAEHLMAVSAGEILRLAINVPPGTTKSTLAAVCWPAWEWMLKPHLRWLVASYSQTFAFRDSRKMRDLILSRGGKPDGTLFERRGYQGILALLGQGWRLAGDQNAKGRYDTTSTGMRLATSPGGGGTGDHADRILCLHGDSLITTSAGQLPIREIVQRRLAVRVLGSSGTWQSIAEHEMSAGRALLEIETADGAKLRCTEDHPIYLDGHGWRPAEAVFSLHGDLHMRRVRDEFRADSFACGARQGGPVLLTKMLGRLPDREPSPPLRREGDAGLPVLRSAVRGGTRGGQAPAVLLDGVRVGRGAGTAAGGMRDLRGVVHPAAASAGTVLQQGLSGRVAPEGRSRRGERPLPARRVGDAVLAGLHEEAAQRGPDTGRQRMRGLRGDGADPAGAPHRRLEDRPSAGEPRDALHLLPPQDPHEAGDQRRCDAPVRIAAVRRVGTPDAVYNLRVEPDHDYYADGLLVHNCDDPLNPEQAYSAADRETVNRWWDGTMTSRFIDDKATAVLVQQRLHEDDLTGHLLALDAGWHHLCLPAEYVPDHENTYPAKALLPSGRVIDGDPRTVEGELLDPKRLSTATLTTRRKELGPWQFSGQFQQQPSPAEGGMFLREWWQRRWQPGFDRYLDRGFDRVIQSWDMRGGIFAGKTSASFVVGQAWGFHGADCYLLAQVRGKFGFADTLHVVTALTEFEPRAVAKLVENKANGPAVMTTLRSKVQGLIPVEPDGDKTRRAAAVTPVAAAGNVILPAAETIPCPAGFMRPATEGREEEWVALEPTTVADWIHELSTFPKGKNDQVDTFSQALNWAKPVVREMPDEDDALREPESTSIMGGIMTTPF